jgi:hypothetical protein
VVGEENVICGDKMNTDEELSTARKGKQVKALGKRDELPETPDFAEWGAPPRKGSPFVLDDFRGSNAYKVNQP